MTNGNGHNGNGNGHKNLKRMRKHELRASDEERNTLTPLVESGEALWQAIGILRMAHEADASAEGVRFTYGLWYEDIGVWVKKAHSTVGKWCSVYAQAGELCPLYPGFGFAHFELFLTQSKREDKPVSDVAEWWAQRDDEYGGRPAPVSVVREYLRGKTKPTPTEQFDAAVAAMQSAHERAVRAVNAGANVPDAARALLDQAGEVVGMLHDAVFVEIVDATTGEAVPS